MPGGEAAVTLAEADSAETKLIANAEASTEKTEEEALAKVLDELGDLGTLDLEAKQELMADLREAKPENRPLIVQQFRSALAFREQLAARELKAASAKLVAENLTDQMLASQMASPSVAVPVSFDIQKTTTPQARPLTPKPKLPVVKTKSAPMARQVVVEQAEVAEVAAPQVLADPPLPIVQQASYVTDVVAPVGRQKHLEAAIKDWQASVNAMPGSTDEVNEHLRLRLLQLLAGDEDAALMPVPGATAAQQDYWSKQLFTVSTFLDSERQPNDKQRAAGSLIHLDQARAKLAELATLQVRKVVFVDSVEGFGAYQVHEKAEFRPGDPITLYAEIENFRSESTKEGYRTSLGTSYEVVDKNGKRVDSAEFPEVEDLCQNVRRDFHMQYSVTLPTRIYPDDYELRLIITDQQSHKIGQASVPFKIVE